MAAVWLTGCLVLRPDAIASRPLCNPIPAGCEPSLRQWKYVLTSGTNLDIINPLG